MGLFGSKDSEAPQQAAEGRLLRAESQAAALTTRLAETGELLRHLDADRTLLLEALERLRPGLPAADLAATLLDLCFKPLGLACFFLALADWEEDLLTFAFYHEAGCSRLHPSRRLSGRSGLSERVLESRQPLYVRTLEEGLASGSLLTAAERATGLVPHSWYGVPLGWGEHPMGLLSFQSFQTDAFPPERRRLMDALGRILALCLAQSR